MSEPIRRWREGGGDATDQRIGALLRQVSEPASLPEGRLERVAAALERPVPRRRRPMLRWAVAALVLGSGSVVFARHQIARLLDAVTAPPAPPVVVAPVVPARRSSRPVAQVAPLPTVDPLPAVAPSPAVAPDPAPSPPPVVHEAPAVVHEAPVVTRPRPTPPPPSATRVEPQPAPIAPPAPVTPPASAVAPTPPPPPPPGLGDEARIVRRALEKLRQAHDAGAALAILDEHRARFRGGVLRADAELLRVEALLALDRGAEALVILDRLDLADSPRADELAVTRGELRAARDCAAALTDFQRAASGSTQQALVERALRGKAVCLLRLGDERAPAAMRDYLDRFPRGAFAAEARRRLHLAP
jgi:hypothetical protein